MRYKTIGGCGFRSMVRRLPAFTLAAFTLVELLVVIGIIALLISILLPTLAKARQASQRAACAAKLHAIMIAANAHAAEHKGYWPIVGVINQENGATFTPQGLNDTYTTHYTYMGWTGLTTDLGLTDIRLLAPIDIALGTEMGFTRLLGDLTDAQQAADGNDPKGLWRNFLCPSQASVLSDLLVSGWIYCGNQNSSAEVGYIDQMSYIWNEAVLGYDDAYGRLHGLSTAVKQPAKTMFAADGLPGSPFTRNTQIFKGLNAPPGGFPPPYGDFTVYNNSMKNYAPITLADALLRTKVGNTYLAGDPQNFDQIRHQGMMNIAFCDGHVELRAIPKFHLVSNASSPLGAIMTSDPNATALQSVYIVPP